MSAPAIRTVDLRKVYALRGENAGQSVRDVVNARIAGWLGAPPPPPPEIVNALDGVSVEIAAGEVVGLIGPNGAGKTTLVKVLARITRPTAGYAEVRGRVLSILDIGLGFHPDLTGRDNIRLGAAMLGATPAETSRALDAIVAFAGIERFLDSPLKGLSSGMQLRLAFAVAAHIDAEILLIDEVLAVGDAAFQQRCRRRLTELARDGRTVVIVSHHFDVLQAICHRVLQFEHGRIVRSGPAAKVIASYLRDAAPLHAAGVEAD
jgi:lipopolysaccharide transport system ATP-binding protein